MIVARNVVCLLIVMHVYGGKTDSQIKI